MSGISPKQIAQMGFFAHGAGLSRSFSCHYPGWTVRHCGHPTANFPWYGVRPDGSIVKHKNGRAFQFLRDALEAVRDEINALPRRDSQ